MAPLRLSFLRSQQDLPIWFSLWCFAVFCLHYSIKSLPLWQDAYQLSDLLNLQILLIRYDLIHDITYLRILEAQAR